MYLSLVSLCMSFGFIWVLTPKNTLIGWLIHCPRTAALSLVKFWLRTTLTTFRTLVNIKVKGQGHVFFLCVLCVHDTSWTSWPGFMKCHLLQVGPLFTARGSDWLSMDSAWHWARLDGLADWLIVRHRLHNRTSSMLMCSFMQSDHNASNSSLADANGRRSSLKHSASLALERQGGTLKPHQSMRLKKRLSMYPHFSSSHSRINFGDADDDVHLCILCLRAIMNHQVSLQYKQFICFHLLLSVQIFQHSPVA